MEAASIEEDVADVDNFGAIVDEKMLKRLKIFSLPVYIVVYVKGHWICIYIDEKVVEIMDSDGYLGTESVSSNVCAFVCAHACGKSLLVTPRLQRKSGALCGFFVVVFILFRHRARKSLCKLMEGFSSDLERNEEFIKELYYQSK